MDWYRRIANSESPAKELPAENPVPSGRITTKDNRKQKGKRRLIRREPSTKVTPKKKRTLFREPRIS